ncbi:hypothetical protein XU06_31850 (plasmid) [Rhodococcus erythropolis]|uniref:linalool dehydratase/isomerase domain-containing protein n=1 Tax=Rhodococcus erythropolis TaxID=1833 RepID=UPI00061B87AC|nr:hypothetical protein [Rhodococcus erythropolis]AKE01511.1 hypothetical protein XU06_31850 [Rhodococcus erythropolis]
MSSISRRSLFKNTAALAVVGATVGAFASACSTATTASPAAGAPFDLQGIPAVDDTISGHIKHIQNLAARLPGDWSLMGIEDPVQFSFSGYRFQLPHMAYALASAHYHRLPAAPGYFRSSYESLMSKMMRTDVWFSWMDHSMSGVRFDPDITELRQPWADPLRKENIMFSGHVLAMTGYHNMLFNSDKYEQPGSLRFERNLISGGLTGEDEVYEYDFGSLTKNIFKQMEENQWVGVPCEPNCIFQLCNQFPIIGMRFHDHRHGTDFADVTTRNYSRKWSELGWLDKNGQFNQMYMPKQKMITPDMYMGPWLHPYMNTWNGKMMRETYPQQSQGILRHVNAEQAYTWPFDVLPEVRKREQGGQSTDDIDLSGTSPKERFGYSAVWLSEMGDTDLDKMLAYADARFSPTWLDGGLYYPRNDQIVGADGHMTYCDPKTGNALLAQARINVEDGYQKMYQQPWTEDHFAKPSFETVDGDIYVTRAAYSQDERALVLTASPVRAGATTDIKLEVPRAAIGSRWELFLGNESVLDNDIRESDSSGRVQANWADDRITLNTSIDDTTTVTLKWT